MRTISDDKEQAQQFERDHTLKPPTDPREVNHPDAYNPDEEGVWIDPSKAVLASQMYSCLITSPDGEPGVAFQIVGRINQSRDEVAVTHVVSVAALAKMVGQLIELAVSTGEETAHAFQRAMQQELHGQATNHEAFIRERRGDEDEREEGS